ncbi:MAG: SusC/RagA family TonB-linked outer membrane protein [Chitinophagaceae bacterium]|nr:SusC/RagA family TonB-linked outer membrane protein [Chitinophagaceae bacterium]
MRIFELLPACLRVRGPVMRAVLSLLLIFSTLVLSAQLVNRALDKKITYKVSNVTLAEALRKLKELCGVHITFNQEDVNKETGITVSATDKVAREVLDKILANSALMYAEGTEGNILLVPKKNKKESPRAGKFFNVNGQVIDPNGNPLSNASIMVMPEKRGLSTDNNGMFNLVAKENDVLVFSYLGMKPSERTIKKDIFLKVALDTAPVVMTEYVVTGYQKIDKRMLTGAVTVLKSEDFMQPGVASVAQMLQGKVPGMTTVFNSGSPSATPKIRIRGTSTILGNAAPLWVVDDIIREDNVNLNPLQLNAALSEAANSNFAIVGNAISGVNPNDIESITVLKDAAATSVYGVRAANGVIVVKTKRGKAGPTNYSYSGTFGLTNRPNYNKMYLMNSQERVAFSREMINDGIYYAATPIPVSYEGLVEKLNNREITQDEFAAKVKDLEYMNTDWLKLLGRNAFNQNHSIGVSGGTGKTAYYFSVGYNSNKGAMKGDDLELYSARANIDIIPSTKFRASFGLDASYRKAEGFFGVNPLDYALRTSRAISPDDFYRKSTAGLSVNGVIKRFDLHYNILNELAQTGSNNNSSAANLTASWNYRPLRGLNISGAYGLNAGSNTAFSFQTDRSYAVAQYRMYDFGAFDKSSPEFAVSPYQYGGVAYPSNSNMVSFTARTQASYDLLLFGSRDQFNVNLVQEVRSTKMDGISSVEIGYFPDRGNTYFSDFKPSGVAPRHTIISTNTLENFMSWLGMISYRLMGKYTFYGNIRTDGSNRFGQYSNQKFLPNWSLSARWDVMNEGWFKQLKWLTQLSVRGSYGSQGNVVNQVGPNLIATYPTMPFDPRSGESVLSLKSLPYPELRWEKSKSLNIGVDASFLEGRINMVFNYWNKKTSDLLTARKIGHEYGIDEMYMNYGSMENHGWDFSLSLTPVRTRDFEWSQSFNAGYTKNKVQNADSRFTYVDYLTGRAVVLGRPLESFYSFPFVGLSAVNGIPLYDFGKNKAGYAEDNPATWLVYSGPSDPTVEIGSTTSMRYKRFSLSASFVLKMGNKKRLNQLFTSGNSSATVPGPESNLTREYLDRWKQPGDELKTNIPAFVNRPAAGWDRDKPYVLNSSLMDSPYYLYDLSTARLVSGNFFRCTFLSVSYVFPDRSLLKFGIKRMNLSGNVSNPFMITNKAFRGQDPETTNLGSYALPITQNFSLGLGIDF